MNKLRVMTYNVHGCAGIDFRRSEERITKVIEFCAPDVVALQELDLARKRSAHVDQAGFIAQRLGFVHEFHPAMSRAQEHYGDAILSRFPLKVVRKGTLPSEHAFPFREQRGALWVEVEIPGGPCHVITSHFGIGAKERMAQGTALGSWIAEAPAAAPLVVLGDFNSLPGSPVLRKLASGLKDVRIAGSVPAKATYPTPVPVLRIDHVFVNSRVTINSSFVLQTRAAYLASDHLPLIADLTLQSNS